jgi:hypothetical protein
LKTARVVAAGIGGPAAMAASPAHAQGAMEAEIVGFHQLCEKGGRQACVRFGILIGRNEQHHTDWYGSSDRLQLEEPAQRGLLFSIT